MKLSILFLPLFLFISNFVSAQDKEYTPTAIFLQLNTGNRQIKYFTDKGRTKDVKELAKDLATLKEMMIGDFTANFDLLPVYYFNDTDLSKILAHDLQGVLKDNMEKPLSSKALSAIDSHFYIVYYGTPMSSNKNERTGEISTPAILERVEKGLVVMNNQDELLPRFPYFISCSNLRRKGPFGFTSENFDLEYKTTARRLQSRLAYYFFSN